MFYSAQILSRKGPLGMIWIAASLGEKKLKKHHVSEIDIVESVDSIIFPDAPLALRLSGQLLLGVVRIYLRKVKFLFDDCESVLEAIKQAFKTSALTLTQVDREGATAHRATITLPDTMAAAGLDPALLPLELNLELMELGPEELLNQTQPLDQRVAGKRDKKGGRRSSMSTGLPTRRGSLTGLELPSDSGGYLGHEDEHFDLGDGDLGLGVTARDVAVEAERLRAAQKARSSDRRLSLGMEDAWYGGGEGDPAVEVERAAAPEGTPAGRRLSIGAAGSGGAPLSVNKAAAARGQATPAKSGAAAAAAAAQAGPTPKSLRSAPPGSPLEDDLLPPPGAYDLGVTPMGAARGQLDLQVGSAGRGGGTPRGSEGRVPSNGAAAAAAAAPAARVLRKRKMAVDVAEDGNARTTLPGAQIKALLKDRAPLVTRRGRAARARQTGRRGADAAVEAAAEAAIATPLTGPRPVGPTFLDLAIGQGGAMGARFDELMKERAATAAAAAAAPSPAPNPTNRRASAARRSDAAEAAAAAAERGPGTGRTPSGGRSAAPMDADAGGMYDDTPGAAYDDYLPGGTPPVAAYPSRSAQGPAMSRDLSAILAGAAAQDDDAADGVSPPVKRPRRGEAAAAAAAAAPAAAAGATGAVQHGAAAGQAAVHGALTTRGKALLSYLKGSFERAKGPDPSLSMESMLQGKRRSEAARMFYELLVLKAYGHVELAQRAPYEDVMVSAAVARVAA